MSIDKTTWIISLFLMLLTASNAWADDHDRARLLLEQGKILSLSDIMKQANTRFPGKILEIELEEKKGVIVYEVELLGEDGVVMEMLIDAQSGRMISLRRD
ncbi:MAG: PepSY domain-containing protein [Mariprofundaceae bacterium]